MIMSATEIAVARFSYLGPSLMHNIAERGESLRAAVVFP